MLDERKEKAIAMIISGESITDVAKLVGVYRSTIYDWLKDDEFKAELDKRRQEIIVQGNNIILNELGLYIKELKKIALKGSSEKSRIDASTYLVDRILGKTTTKIENINDGKDKDNVSKDLLEEEFKEFDNE